MDNTKNLIAPYIKDKYDFDINNCSSDDLLKVTEIIVKDVTGYGTNEIFDWDFSIFPNLTKLSCTYNYVYSMNISKNTLLEEIDWTGVRGGFKIPLNLSNNIHLRKIFGGQDGIVELDLSNNTELEIIALHLSNSLRWLNLDNCTNLKRINMEGTLIPFVDLTHCHNLEYCNINYMNQYIRKENVYGDGFPRPIIFVAEDFNTNVIETKSYMSHINPYFSYLLIKVKPQSAESQFLQILKSQKDFITSIPNDSRGENIAQFHYKMLDILKNLKR